MQVKHFLLLLCLISATLARWPVMKLTPNVVEMLKQSRIHHENVKQVIDPSLPDQFDGRQQWPNCIHSVLDQGSCGSCWAFASTETLSDRFCIYSGGKVNVVLSPENLLACESENLGCTLGSLPNFAWSYFQEYGVVSNECVPYTSGDGTVETCTYDDRQCTSGAPWQLYYVKNYTHVGSTIDPSSHVNEIMMEVMNGPVDVTFDVWSDFQEYNGGIYEHESGSYEGLHSVKIIGWGVENGVDYWLVQNSWGSNWGPYGGYFKIRRGVDECFIEALVYTGIPSL